MKRSIVLALLALALTPVAAGAQQNQLPTPGQDRVNELMARRSAQGEVEGRVLLVGIDPNRPMPRTAQVTLECAMISSRMRDCRVYSESVQGIGYGLIGQTDLLWMVAERPNPNRTVHILFDITGGAAAIGRSDPPGVVILGPRAERVENSGFRALDRDRDGRLSYEEARVIDANRDGKVDMAEFERNFRVALGKPGRSFGHFDLDDDGVINLEELQGAYRPQSIEDLRQ